MFAIPAKDKSKIKQVDVVVVVVKTKKDKYTHKTITTIIVMIVVMRISERDHHLLPMFSFCLLFWFVVVFLRTWRAAVVLPPPGFLMNRTNSTSKTKSIPHYDQYQWGQPILDVCPSMDNQSLLFDLNPDKILVAVKPSTCHSVPPPAATTIGDKNILPSITTPHNAAAAGRRHGGSSSSSSSLLLSSRSTWRI